VYAIKNRYGGKRMVTEERNKVTVRRMVIIRRRLELGLKPIEVTKRAGLRHSEVWKAENRGLATPRVIKALAEVLELKQEDFVDIELRDSDKI